jgi:hypothetical protein
MKAVNQHVPGVQGNYLLASDIQKKRYDCKNKANAVSTPEKSPRRVYKGLLGVLEFG